MHKDDIKYIKGPDGAHLTITDLPKVGTTRWVTKRKAIVVAAVGAGLITIEEACERYKLSTEEFFSWQSLVTTYGTAGLRITQLRTYRG